MTHIADNDKRKMPAWLPDALATAQTADKLGLNWDEAEWLRKRVRDHPNNPYHWRVIWLYIKSNYTLWWRRAK